MTGPVKRRRIDFGRNTNGVIWFRKAGRIWVLDAIRIGHTVVEFYKSDPWMPLFARRVFQLGRFRIWKDGIES